MRLAARNPREEDTIAAIATPAGEGAIGIVRLSGSRAIEIAGSFFRARSGKPLGEQPSFTARLGAVVRPGVPAKTVDEAMVLVMRAPKTYTREDMVEISAHGGPAVLRAILGLAAAAGARPAEPGEFTKRAFLNGRIDLLQAEAVLDLIHAKSERARSFASSQLEGELSARAGEFRETLVDILSHLEAEIDFPDDFPDAQAAARLLDRLDGVIRDASRLLNSAALGFVAKRGVRAVIWGPPNVGKSSLLNALSRKNRVIVTPHPGTTRDIVEEEIELAGFPVRLVDTAGIQETADPIEQEGVARSRLAVLSADLILHVVDSSRPAAAGEDDLLDASSGKPRIVVLNKSDLPGRVSLADLRRKAPGCPIVSASCETESGIRDLEEALREFLAAGKAPSDDEPVVSSVRQKELLEKMLQELERARETLLNGLSAEFPASDIRRGLGWLSELTGEITHDEVLDRLFTQFCIGK